MQVAYVLSHFLLMSLSSFKISINWNKTTGLVRLIILVRCYSKYFLSPWDRGSWGGGYSHFLRNEREQGFSKWERFFVLKCGFIELINLACNVCSPVCPQGNYHSLLIFLHWKAEMIDSFQSWNKKIPERPRKEWLFYFGYILHW